MLKFFARRALQHFENKNDYDVSYMRFMLDNSPSAFFKFSRLSGMAAHCEAATPEAAFAASITGALAEDCGPCVQLVVNMAREAGVDRDQIEAVLTRDIAAMNADTKLGFDFADAVICRSPAADEAREAVRARWGDKGVIDLTFNLQIGRIFPMAKAGLGYAKTCQRVEVGDSIIEVIKEAA